MNEIEKWKRMSNPTCAEDYGLSVNIVELMKTEEGMKIFNEEIIQSVLEITSFVGEKK